MKPKYFPDVYVERNPIVNNKLKDFGKSVDSKTNMINLRFLNLDEKEKWDFLNGLKLRGRSRSSIIFKKETTPKIAQLLGFIITDGSLLSTEGRIKLCQRDLNLIKRYMDIINKEYNTSLAYSFDGKEANIGSVPLRYILNKYYNIPLGKKVRIVEVPRQILSSKDKNVMRGFIAGLFDGDGYIQYYYLKGRPILDRANFCISTSSHNLIRQSSEILEKLGIANSISQRNDGRLTLQTSGFLNSLKFYEQIIPLIFHTNRRKIADRIFLGKDFTGKFTVLLNKGLRSLFKRIRDERLDRELLVSFDYKYIKSLRSIESWTYPSKSGKIRSIYIYKACKLLNKDPSIYIPEDQLKYIANVIK